MNDLSKKIKSLLLLNGANVVGFADISELPEEIRKGLKYAISIGIALNPEIVKEIDKGPTRSYFNEYKFVNKLLASLCRKTQKYLTTEGFQGYIIKPTTESFNKSTLSTKLPHKTIATRTGIGWIGKSALLVTKQYGTAVRLSSVLTDAKLSAGTPVNESFCGKCNTCVTCCPAKAITGENWHMGLDREELYDAFACRKVCGDQSKELSIPSTICGICINVCPWTQKYLGKEK